MTMTIGDQIFVENKIDEVWPKFSLRIRKRLRRKLAVNIVVCGEAGIGKSYMGIDIARVMDKKFDPEKQVVYTYSEYMEQIMHLRKRGAIVFDEPSYAMGKREWYKEINQALVKTMESQRFMQHPVIIPIINMTLLDKVIRSHLIQFMVYVYGRGLAIVYRIKSSQMEEKTYYQTICRLEYGLMDSDKCDKDSCLDCVERETCNIMRAKYERKKSTIQMSRYLQDKEQALEKENKNMTIDELVNKAFSLRATFLDETGKIDAKKLRVVLREQADVRIGHNKAYEIRTVLEMRYPTIFTQA